MYKFTDIGWLWLNAIGALSVVSFAFLLQQFIREKT
jgi:hypothetical protein